MAFKCLKMFSCFHIPQTCSMIKTSRKDLSSLGIKNSLWYLSLMPLKNKSALKSSCIINSHCHVHTCSHEAGSNRIKIEIKNLVSVTPKNWHTFSCSNIPNSAGFIYWSCSTHVASKFKLSTWNLSSMPLKDMNWLTWFSIPYLNKKEYTIAVPSKDPVSILSPSALKLRDTIYPSWPFRVECSFPVSKSHNFAVWSIDPVAQRLLWGSKATATTSFWWPAKV